MGTCRSLCESKVVVCNERRSEPIGLVGRGDPPEAKFPHEPVLQCLISTLDAAFRLRTITDSRDFFRCDFDSRRNNRQSGVSIDALNGPSRPCTEGCSPGASHRKPPARRTHPRADGIRRKSCMTATQGFPSSLPIRVRGFPSDTVRKTTSPARRGPKSISGASPTRPSPTSTAASPPARRSPACPRLK